MASPAMQQLPSYKYRTLCILWWINKYKNLLNERSKNKDQSLAKSLVFNLGILSNKWREKASVEESDLITNWADSIPGW